MLHKHLTNRRGMELLDVNQIVSDMNAEWPRKPSDTAGLSYEEIARKWLYVMPFKVINNRHWSTDDDNCIQIPVTELRNAFPHKYNGNNKWWNWFHNNYPLYMITNVGNSLSGKVSEGVPLIHVIDGLMQCEPSKFVEAFEVEFDADKPYDKIQIDADNLERYINQTYNNWAKLSDGNLKNTLQRYLIDALAIHNLAVGFDCVVECKLSGKKWLEIPQNYEDKHSGRRYYTGAFALQRMSSVVRSAALGPCFEVDLRASVYSFYKWLLKGTNTDTTVLTEMFNNKKRFRETLAHEVLVDTNTNFKHKVELIKQAITAQGFGARDGVKGGAIRNIIRNYEDYKRLIAHPDWIAMRAIKTGVTEVVKADFQDAIKDFRVHCKAIEKKFSHDKFLSHMYQQYETMAIAVAKDLSKDREVLLWVHDGIYMRRRPDMLIINTYLRDLNEYCGADMTQIGKWTEIHVDIEDDILDHKTRMQIQQWKAEGRDVNEVDYADVRNAMEKSANAFKQAKARTHYNNNSGSDYNNGYNDGSNSYEE